MRGATRRSNREKFKKSAFTLAEVLITLGIIGVVAAMTIPTLMQKTNDSEIVASLLKSQSVLNNAFKNIEAINGVKVTQISDVNTFGDYLVSHLKTVNDCEDYDVCLADGSGLNFFDFWS